MNPHLKCMKSDYLYHFALSTEDDLITKFGDVKFIFMGGKDSRMEMFAKKAQKELGLSGPLPNISAESHRFCMYKVGPILAVSHGMGISSISICLHEIIKLVYHAQMKDATIFRLGSCGGIGVDAGTVIITSVPVDGMLNSDYVIPCLGKEKRRPAILNQEITQELKAVGESMRNFKTVIGKTVCASDFYEEQGRTDGAFCDFTEKDKFDYLRHLHANGVRNMEMEAIPFGALTHQAGIRSAIICVAFINRLETDQVTTPKEQLVEFEEYPCDLVIAFVKRKLGIA